MLRREFLGTLGTGLLATSYGSGALPIDPVTSAGSRPSTSDRKSWAREHFRGMENFVLPSFSPDFRTLDEEGIRHDVRHAVRQGFVSTMPMYLGLDRDERRRMLEIVADEARGRILVTTTLGGEGAERSATIDHAERVGASQAFYTIPSSYTSEAGLLAAATEAISSTRLDVVLYGRPADAFLPFDASGLPLEVLDRLADLPNVIAIKLTQVIDPVTAYQVADRLGDRLLIGPVNLELVPLLAARTPIQWSGQWAVDALQSPEKPYASEFMRLVGQGRVDEAIRVYRAMYPAYRAFFDLQAPLLRTGAHPWSHIKYYHWVSGGNGGLLRAEGADHMPTLDAAARRAIRHAMASVGIEPPRGSDEAFVVGDAAYRRGVRAGDLGGTPHYEA
jgi:4-hydroxy-tetrahydrodipicolinate synthase